MRWPWSRGRAEPTALGINDPTLRAMFIPTGWYGVDGVEVGEYSALGNSAVYRGVSLVAGTLAGLSMNSWTGGDTDRHKVPSIFDNPDTDDGQTTFEWKETAFVHLMLFGRCGALKIWNVGGGLSRLKLLHPTTWQVELPTIAEYQANQLPAGGLWFTVLLATGERKRFDANDFWYVPALSTDGVVGRGLLNTATSSLGVTIAGDRAAGKSFSSGATISGLATPRDSDTFADNDELTEARRQISNATSGVDNAGGIALINRTLDFTPWTMTAQQAQFLESRQFQIEEVARWTGVPPHLLMQTDKQTSWGTGVDEQNRGLSKFVLGQWAQRFEQRASRLLARPRWVEFDFASLERPNFPIQVDLVLQQIQAGLISKNYGRKLLNIPQDAAPPADELPAPDPNGGTDDPPTE